MNQELQDFQYFRDKQLYCVNYVTGVIDTKAPNACRKYYNVGSYNEDGYIRIWCHKKLRMKHRLLYFLYHNDIPKQGYEIDHFDSNRSNNSIGNLRILKKADNNRNSNNHSCVHRSIKTIHQICKLLAYTNISDLKIAKICEVSRGTIRDIKTRQSRISIGNLYTWSHRGY